MNSLLSGLLYPLSLPYRTMVQLDRKLTAARALPRPVISVGNITWGGTGKTPMVIRLARDVLGAGLKPVILTRGYKRTKGRDACRVVSDGKNISVSPGESGDEPWLLAQSVPGAAVIVGTDRFACGMRALEKLSCDVFILDDGFQHWGLKRDYDIVCVNALNPFGNGCLIPAGILREPVASLKRADMVVITNADRAPEEKLAVIEKRCAGYYPGVFVRAGFKVVRLKRLRGEESMDPAQFRRRAVVAISAIGDNAGFRKTIEQSGMEVIEHYTFRDHHWYAPDEIALILLKHPGECPLLITAKDAVKIGSIAGILGEQDRNRFFVLEGEVSFITGEKHWEGSIKNALPFS